MCRTPLPGSAAAALRSIEPGDPNQIVWPFHHIRRFWDQVRSRAAKTLLPDLAAAARPLPIHDVRHHASHYWRPRGVPDRLIDQLLGHRTPIIAQRYAVADAREVGAACAWALVVAPPTPHPAPHPDDHGSSLDVPDIITIDFDCWHRQNWSRASGGGD